MISIKFNKKALNDLDKIFKIIVEDKPKSARAYVLKIREFIDLLKYNPQMGVTCRAKYINRNCRVLIYDNYMIEYKIHKDYNISINQIINTKQKRK